MDSYDEQESARREQARAAANARHAGNLRAVDALLALEAQAAPGPWQVFRAPINDTVATIGDQAGSQVGASGLTAFDAALMVTLRNSARIQLQARRGVLEHHRPSTSPGPHLECAHCVDTQENAYEFPCPEYLAAELGLVMPHLTFASSLPEVRLASVSCVCCGWVRTFGHARDTAIARQTTLRLAAVWGRRHEQGDADAQDDVHATGTCATCDTAIRWDPDDPTGQEPRWRHVDQAASYASPAGAHRAMP